MLQVWHANVPHDKLVSYKRDQNWVKKQDDYLVFPGGGTQFKNGALQYISTIQKVTFVLSRKTFFDLFKMVQSISAIPDCLSV